MLIFKRWGIVKKLFSFLLIIAIMISCTPAYCLAADMEGVSVSAQAAIVINAGTGEVLFEKNADSQMLIASTTKIMTALVVLENCALDDMVKITSESANVEGSSAYLVAGEEMSVRELLYCLMLSSGNDAASALAIHVSGSIEDFAVLMNEKAKELGLENTSYKNPHGLDADGHYSSARDLATLTAYALENNDFLDIVSTKTATVGSRTLTNHNKLLWSVEGAIGVKTGYTMAAGRILVSAVDRDGMRFICVTIDDPNDWEDHTAIYEKLYGEYETRQICKKDEVYGEIAVIGGTKETTNIVFEDSLTIMTQESDEVETVFEVPEFSYAKISKGDRAGTLKVYINGNLEHEVGIIYAEDVDVDESQLLSLPEKILRIIRLSFKYSGEQYSQENQ